MTVIVNAGVLYADRAGATQHEPASNALESVYDDEYGLPYISDYIYDEAVTLTLKRGDSFAAAKRLGERLRGDGPYPQTYEMLRVSAPVFTAAMDIFERYDDQELSFTDATTVALVRCHDIDRVLSFDDDFDSLVDRINPSAIR
jgi:predicted nucleic acid-binding protein